MNSIQYKAELALVRSQNIDITNFEEKMNKFKEFLATKGITSEEFATKSAEEMAGRCSQVLGGL